MFNSHTPQTHARPAAKAAGKAAARPAVKAAARSAAKTGVRVAGKATAKPLLCALLTLAVAAGVLLAVALPEPTPAAAQTLAIDLVAASDTGADDDNADPSTLDNADNQDNITSDTTPSFEIATTLVDGASLTVTATNKSNDNTVSRTLAALTLPFSGSNCTASAKPGVAESQSCDLSHGIWDITFAVNYRGETRQQTDRLTITIDTVAPTVTASPASVSVVKNASVAVMLTINEDVGSFPTAAIAPSDPGVATVAVVPGTGRSRTLTVSGVDSGTANITLNAGASKLSDVAGNVAATDTSLVAVTVTAAALAAPTEVDLDEDSDSGPDDTGEEGSMTIPKDPSRSNTDNMDNITKENMPDFTVTLPTSVTNASVTVTAASDHDNNPTTDDITVSRTKTGITGNTAKVEFSGSQCDASEIDGTPGSELCTLADGTWEVTATYTHNGQTSAKSPVLGDSTDPAQKKLLKIDTLAPAMIITVADDNLEVFDELDMDGNPVKRGEITEITFAASEAITGFEFSDRSHRNHGQDTGRLLPATFGKKPSPAVNEYKVDFQADTTPDDTKLYRIWIPANSFMDLAGNQNELSNIAWIGVDLTDTTPQPSITGPPAGSVVGQKVTLTGDEAGPLGTVVITSGFNHVETTADNDGNWQVTLDLDRVADGDFTASVRAIVSEADVNATRMAPSPLKPHELQKKSDVPVISATWFRKTGDVTETEAIADVLVREGTHSAIVLRVTATPAPSETVLDVDMAIDLPEQYFDATERSKVEPKVQFGIGETTVEYTFLVADDKVADVTHQAKARVVAGRESKYALTSGEVHQRSNKLVNLYFHNAQLADYDDSNVFFVAEATSVNEDTDDDSDPEMTFTVRQLFSHTEAKNDDGTLKTDVDGNQVYDRVQVGGADLVTSDFGVTIGSSESWNIAYRFVDCGGRTCAANGTDYTGTAGTLTFPPNLTGTNPEGTQEITVTIDNDDDGEAAETFTLELSNPGQSHDGFFNFLEEVGGTQGWQYDTPLTVTGTINRSDGGPVSQKPTLTFTGTDAEAATTDLIETNVNTPSFKVTDVVAGASLSVTATRNQIAGDPANLATFTVSKPTVTVPATPTVGGEPFDFSVSGCITVAATSDGTEIERLTGQSCTLDDYREWSITATQTETSPSLPATDSDSLTLDVDTTAPTVAVSIDDDKTSVQVGDTATVRFTFSEPIDAGTFGTDDLAVTPDNVTAAEPVVASDDPDPTNPTIYTMEVTGATSGGSDSFSVAANKFEDVAGNENTAASTPAPAPALAVTVATSSVPTVDLATASDTGADDTGNADSMTGPIDPSRSNDDNNDDITKATDLNFEIGNVAAGAILTVTASRDATFPAVGVEEVSRTVMVDAGNTSGTETVDFMGSSTDTNCTDADGAAVRCLLNEGNAWKVIATHTDGSKPKSSTPDAEALELVIDQTAPTVTLSAGSIAVAQGGDPRAVTLTFDEAIGSFPDDAIIAPNDTYVTLAAPVPDPSDPKIYTLEITGKLATPAGSPVILELVSGKITDLAGTAAAGSSTFMMVTVNAPLAAPTVDLATASDSGPGSPVPAQYTTDNITNDNTPSFTVMLPAEASGASVTVTAARDHDDDPTTDDMTVTRTVTGVTGTMATVEFSGTGCDTEDAGEVADESCTLADTLFVKVNDMNQVTKRVDQPWLLTATWSDGTQDSPASSPALAVTIDTVAPTVAAFARNHRLAASGDPTVLDFVVSESHDNLVGLEGPEAIKAGALSERGGAGSVGATDAFTRSGNTYSVTFTAAVADGVSAIRMPAGRFHDKAGNPNVLSNVVRVSVGRTDTDDITRTPTITSPPDGARVGARLGLTGRAEAGSRIDITAGTVGVTAIAQADADGYWSVDLSGVHLEMLDVSRFAHNESFTVTVRATAPGKAPSLPSSPRSFVRDAQKPAVRVAWDTGQYDERFVASFGDPTLTVTSDQPAPAGGLAVKVDIDLPARFFDDPGTTGPDEDESVTDNAGLAYTVLTIPEGDLSVTRSFAFFADRVHEPGGRIEAEIEADDSKYVFGGGPLATSPVRNPDPGVYFVAQDMTWDEGAGTVSFTVTQLFAIDSVSGTALQDPPRPPRDDTRTIGTSEEWTIAYRLVDGTAKSTAGDQQDYFGMSGMSGTLTFLANPTGLDVDDEDNDSDRTEPLRRSQMVTVRINEDEHGEEAETFELVLANPTDGQTHGDVPLFRKDLGSTNGYDTPSGNELHLTGTINRSDGGAPSAPPTGVALYAGDPAADPPVPSHDTGSSDADGITRNTTPTFTVSFAAPVTNTTVKVTATQGMNTVSRSRTIPTGTSLASVDIDFVDDNCETSSDGGVTTQTGESCALTIEDDWTVTASNTASGKATVNLAADDAITVHIDTTAPTVTVTASTGAQVSERTFTASDGEAGTTATLNWAVVATAGDCPAATAAGTYTEGGTEVSRSSTADNGQVMCFWLADVAGNTGSGTAAIAGIDPDMPTVTVATDPAGITEVRVNGTVNLVFTLNEAAGSSDAFEAGDVVVGEPDTATATLSNFAGSGTSFTATLNVGSSAGSVSVSVPAGRFEDAAGNDSQASNTLTFTVKEISSAPSVDLAVASDTGSDDQGEADDPSRSNVDNQDNITSAAALSFMVGSVVERAELTITATQMPAMPTDPTVKLVRTMQVGTGNTSETVVFSASHTDCTETTTPADGGDPVIETSHSCELGAGDWSVIATHAETNKFSTDSAAALSVTIDRTAPVVTPAGPANTDPATSKSVTATAVDTGGSGVASASFSYRLNQGSTCADPDPAATPPVVYTAYTAGASVTVTDDAYDYVCFRAADTAGNVHQLASAELAGLDTTGPIVTITTTDTFTVGATGEVTFAFNEEPTGFVVGDIDPGAKLELVGSLTGPSIVRNTWTYTANFKGLTATDPDDPADLATISLPVNQVTDALGNGNPAPAPTAIPVTGTLSLTIGAQLPSAKPVAAFDGTDAITATANVFDTTDNTPAFKVTNAQARASLTLTATRDRLPSDPADLAKFAVTETAITVPATPTVGGEPVRFLGTDCTTVITASDGTKTAGTDPSCTLTDGDWQITVTQTETDKAPTSSDPLALRVDTMGPTATLALFLDNVPVTSVAVGATATVRFTFSEPVAGFALNSVMVTDDVPTGDAVRLSNLQGSGLQYTADLSGLKAGTATLTLPAGEVADLAGNDSTMAAELEVAVVSTTLTLKSGSDSNIEGDGITNVASPTFVVSPAPAGTSVTVTARQGSALRSRTVTFAEGATSVEVPFEDRNCATTAGGAENQPCELDPDGRWQVIATNAAGDTLATLNLQVDTVAPVVTVSGPASAAPARFKLVAVSDDAPAGGSTWFVRSHGPALACPAEIPGGNTPAQEISPDQDGSNREGVRLESESYNGRQVCVWSHDVAGNVGVAGSSVVRGIDRTAPTIIALVAANPALEVGESTLVTVFASEPVVGLDLADIVVAGGAGRLSDWRNVLAADPTNLTAPGRRFTARFTATAVGTAQLSIPGQSQLTNQAGEVVMQPVLDEFGDPVAPPRQEPVLTSPFTDVAGNPSVDGYGPVSIAVTDTRAPTISLSADQLWLAPGAPTTLRFTASEPIRNFIASDIELLPGTRGEVSNPVPENPSGPSRRYTATFTAHATNRGEVRVRVPANMFVDAANNPNTAASNTITLKVGLTPPPVILLPIANTFVRSSAAVPGTAETVAMSGTAAPGATVTVDAPGSVQVRVTADSVTGAWAAVLTLGSSVADGPVTLSASAKLTGWDSSAVVTRVVHKDTVAPVIQIPIQPADGPAPFKNVAATASDPGTGQNGIASFEYAIARSCSSPVPAPGERQPYVAGSYLKLTPSYNGQQVCFFAADFAGNTAQLASAVFAGMDATAPTMTITAGDTTLNPGETTTVTFTASEPSRWFEYTDIVLSGSAARPHWDTYAAASDQMTYSVDFAALAAGAYVISVPVGAFQDLAGNPNAARATLVILVGAVSSQPAIELHADSDTGLSRSDRITRDNTPDFTVSNVTSGATVLVSATQSSGSGSNSGSGTVTVARQLQVPASQGASSQSAASPAASVRVPFAGNSCDRNGDGVYRETCTLGDGNWQVTATHTDGSLPPTPSSSLAVTIDTVAPQLTAVSPTAVSLDVGGSATVRLDVSESVPNLKEVSFRMAPTGVATLSLVTTTTDFLPAGDPLWLRLAGDKAGSTTVELLANWLVDRAGNRGPAVAETLFAVAVGPQITVSSPDTSPARSKMVSAIDNYAAGATTWKRLVQAASVCAATPPPAAVAYTEGSSLEVTNENNNGKYVCFWSAHAASATTVSARSDQLGGIDVTPPTVTAAVSQVNLTVGSATQVRLTVSENVRLVDPDTGAVLSDFQTPALAAYDLLSAAQRDPGEDPTGVGLDLVRNPDGSYTLTLTGLATRPAPDVNSDPRPSNHRVALLPLRFADAAGNSNLGMPNLLMVTTVPASAETTDLPAITSPEANALLSGSVVASGTAEPHATVEVTFGTLTQTVAADGDGAWTTAAFDTTLLADSDAVTISAVATADGKIPSNRLPVSSIARDPAAPARTPPPPVEVTVTVDNTAPTITKLTVSPALLQAGQLATASFEFSEQLSGLAASNLQLSHIDGSVFWLTFVANPNQQTCQAGQTSNCWVSGVVYADTFLAPAVGSYEIQVAANAFTDRAGNPNLTQTLTFEVGAATSVPVITSPAANAVVAGSLEVRGTVPGETDASVTVSIGSGDEQRSATVNAVNGVWSATLDISHLSGTQSITATATASGKRPSAERQRFVRVGDDECARLLPLIGSSGVTTTEVQTQLGPDGQPDTDIDLSSYPDGRLIFVVTGTDPGKAPVIVCVERTKGTTVIPDPDPDPDPDPGPVATTTPIITTPVTDAKVGGSHVVVAGTAEPGARVTVAFSSLSAVTTTATGGSWAVSVNATSLADGPHTIVATATFPDKLPATTARSVVVDNTNLPATTAPAITSHTANDMISGSLPVTGTTEVDARGVGVTVSVGSVTQTVVTANGNWSATLNVAALSGSQTISAIAIAPNKLASPATTVAVTVDDVAPTIAITPATISLTAGATARVTFTASEPLAAFALTAVEESDTSVASLSGLTPGAGNTYTATLNAHLAGTASFSVPAGRISDTLGNSSVAASNTVNITVTLPPTTPPSITLPAANSTHSGSVMVRGTTEVLAAGVSVTVTIGTADSETVTTTDGNWAATVDISALADGDHNITATAHAAGKSVSAASEAVTITVDQTRPTVTASPTALDATAGGNTVDVMLTVSEPVAGDEILTAAVSLSDETKLEVVSLDGSGSSYTLVLRGLEAGTAMVSVLENQFADAAGNQNEAAANLVTVTVKDRTATPTVRLLAASDTGNPDGPTEFYTMTSTPTFTVSAPTAMPAGIQAGSSVTVTATGATADGTGTVAISRTLTNIAAGDIASGTVGVVFTDATDCTKVTTPNDGSPATTELGQSCLLHDTEWSVTATYHQSSSYAESLASAAISVQVDNTAPTVTLSANPIELPDSLATTTGATTVTFTASEAIVGLDATAVGAAVTSDVTNSLGSWSPHRSRANTYTATLTLTGSGTEATLTATGTFADRAGNQVVVSAMETIAARVQHPALSLRNNGNAALAADPRYFVTVTPSVGSSCKTGRPRNTAYTLAAGAAIHISLASNNLNSCHWSFAATNSASGCRVQKQVNDVGIHNLSTERVSFRTFQQKFALTGPRGFFDSGELLFAPICVLPKVRQSGDSAGVTAGTIDGFLPEFGVSDLVNNAKVVLEATDGTRSIFREIVRSGTSATFNFADHSGADARNCAATDAGPFNQPCMLSTTNRARWEVTATQTDGTRLSSASETYLLDIKPTLVLQSGGTASQPAPVFRVSQVTPAATVTVTAVSSDGATTVARQGTVGAGDTSVDVTLSGTGVCDTNGDGAFAEDCPTLPDGAWTVTATHIIDGAATPVVSVASDDLTVSFDTRAPTATVAVSPATIVAGGATTATVTVTFSEPIDASTFAAADFGSPTQVTLTEPVVSASDPDSANPTIYQLTATGVAGGTVAFELPAGAFSDVAGNPSTDPSTAATSGSNMLTVNWPTPSVDLAAASDSGSSNTDNRTNAADFTFTVSNVEANSTLTLTATNTTTSATVEREVSVGSTVPPGGVTVNLGATHSACTAVPARAGAAGSQSCMLTAAGADETWRVSVSYTKNSVASPTSAVLQLTVDRARPTVTVAASLSSVDVEGQPTLTYTVTGGEQVTGFELGDIDAATGGVLTAVSFPTTGQHLHGHLHSRQPGGELPGGWGARRIEFTDLAGNQNTEVSAVGITVTRSTVAVDLVNEAASANSANPSYNAQVAAVLSGCATSANNTTRNYTLVAGKTQNCAAARRELHLDAHPRRARQHVPT